MISPDNSSNNLPIAKSKTVPRRRASGFTSLIRDISSRNVQSILKWSDQFASLPTKKQNDIFFNLHLFYTSLQIQKAFSGWKENLTKEFLL